jgi:signal transduction histidine kinase/DNA-binding response OmpR family regulator
MRSLVSLALEREEDVVAARRCAAHIGALLEFDVQEQTRIATAVSEIVRNAFRYGGGGAVRFDLDLEARPQQLRVLVEDRGPGIANLEAVLGGRFHSPSGMGLGIAGARRLMDDLSIDTTPAGTRIVLSKILPSSSGFLTDRRADDIAAAIRLRPRHGLADELQRQNQELLQALADLEHKQQELTRLNRELEDTNRGVVALYAELDERADRLRRADDLKSRFLSNMTHEFRTPVNAIIGLCDLLVEEREQERREPEPEVAYIKKAAEQLSTLVNDLLDLAKVEAGRTEVRAESFEVQNLFRALRGMLRPLLLTQSVTLVFEDADGVPPLCSDEAMVSQILRNLISNGLKFTERGEVRVSASYDSDTGMVTFCVADTGIGIEAENQLIVFEEFGQVANRLQRKVRGTGLGLPLSRRLAELLGGTLTLQSEPGVGSVFTVTLAANYGAARPASPPVEWTRDPDRLSVLAIEDSAEAEFACDRMLKGSPFQPLTVGSIGEADAVLETVAPAAILLDLVLGQEAWDFLIRLKRDQRTRHVPVVVASLLESREKALALGADAFLVKPIERATIVETLNGLHARMHPPIRVLVIDDEESARYLIRRCLPLPGFEVIEVPDPLDGHRRARADQPDVIVLDMVMPGITGPQLLIELSADPLTARIPVVIVTGASLTDAEKRTLGRSASAILLKTDLSRHTLPDIVRTALGRAI